MNSARGNEYYDISDTGDSGYQNPAHPESPLCSSDSDSWEPPASVRGDIARSMFYMATRYIGDAANEPALYLTDAVVQISATTNLMGRLSTLLQWHRQDPVSAAEQTRNNLIYSLYQTNRNPFVDPRQRPQRIFLVVELYEPLPLTLAALNPRGNISSKKLTSEPTGVDKASETRRVLVPLEIVRTARLPGARQTTSSLPASRLVRRSRLLVCHDTK